MIACIVLIAGAVLLALSNGYSTVGAGLFVSAAGFILIDVLCYVLPAVLRVNRSLKVLEEKGLSDLAAKELYSSCVQYTLKNRVAVTEHFVFAKRIGVCPVNDILWMYRRRQKVSFLFIPIVTYDFLMLHTAKQQFSIMMAHKDKKEELKQVMIAIYQNNPQILTAITTKTVSCINSFASSLTEFSPRFQQWRRGLCYLERIWIRKNFFCTKTFHFSQSVLLFLAS